MIATDKVGHAAVRARGKKKEERRKSLEKAGQLHHVSGCCVWMCIYLISVTTRYSYQEHKLREEEEDGYFIKVNFTSCRKA